MMDVVADLETGEQIQDLLDRVERGEVVTITRQGRPVARLVPMPPASDRQGAQAAVNGLRALSKGLRLNGLHLKEMIVEGRR